MLSAITAWATHSDSDQSATRQLIFIVISALVVTGSTFYIWTERGSFEGQLLLLGMGLGVCLYNASFGFTTAWRRLVKEKRGEGVRAQMLMLGLSVLLFFPVLSNGEFLGNNVSGFVRPLGFSVIFGAFIFGLGMQIANGCASGNLYHSGGGQFRAVPAMAGFSAGALWATLDYEWWTTLPQLAPVNLIEVLGVIPALLANLLVFLIIYKLTSRLEIRHHGQLGEDSDATRTNGLQRLVRGPWPMIWGAVGLSILNLVTLAMLGRPWAVALAYPVWGAKTAAFLGIDLELDFTTYWLMPGRDTALLEPLTTDPATLMNAGVILGAFAAATMAGKFTFDWKLPVRQWIGAILGGLMLGYGATIAYGCNIGAFVGGVISGSLHGWLWILCAFVGSLIGTRMRPWFKLD